MVTAAYGAHIKVIGVIDLPAAQGGAPHRAEPRPVRGSAPFPFTAIRRAKTG